MITRKMCALGPTEERHATHAAVAAVADAFIRQCREEAAASKSGATKGAAGGSAAREEALLARAGEAARATLVACHQPGEECLI